MKIGIAFCYCLTLAFHTSCKNNDGKVKPKVPIDSIQWATDTLLSDKDSLLNGILQNIYSTVSIDSSDYILLPLAAPLLAKEGKAQNTYYEEASYKSGANYWNLIFYNTRTRESHLLDTGKMLIRELFVNNLEMHGRFADQLVLYSIITRDFNGNGQLDPDDPGYLYISDKEGRNFRRVSPENASVQSWEFPGKRNFILMKLKYDRNKDAVFDQEDPSSLIRVDIDTATVFTPLLNGDFEKKLKGLFKKYYVQKTGSSE